MHPRLVVVRTRGNGVGMSLRLADGETHLVGSAEKAHLCLRSDGLMPVHCAVVRSNDSAVVAPIAPLATVLVNGERIRWADLRDGDSLVLGSAELIFRTVESRAQMKPVSAAHETDSQPVAIAAGEAEASAGNESAPTRPVEAVGATPAPKPPVAAQAEEKQEEQEKTEAEETPKKRYLGKLITAKCDTCRAVVRSVPWRVGEVCPRCGSDKFYPVVQVMSSDAYESADRSSKRSQWDDYYLTVARWSGLIKESEVRRVVQIQEKAVKKGWNVLPADRILCNRKTLDEKQAAALKEVLHFHSRKWGNVERDEADMARMAVSTHALTVRQVEFLRHAQADMMATHKGHVPLCLAAMEKGALTEEKVLVLLKHQKRIGRGILHDVEEALDLMEREGKPQQDGAS